MRGMKLLSGSVILLAISLLLLIPYAVSVASETRLLPAGEGYLQITLSVRRTATPTSRVPGFNIYQAQPTAFGGITIIPNTPPGGMAIIGMTPNATSSFNFQWGDQILTTPNPLFNYYPTERPVETYNLMSAEAYNERGEDRLDNFRLTAAIEDFSRAIELDPEFVPAYINRCRTIRFFDPEAAIEDCTQAIALDPYNARAYYYRSLVKVSINDSTAGADLQRALRLDPDIIQRELRGD